MRYRLRIYLVIFIRVTKKAPNGVDMRSEKHREIIKGV
jgi:hypothetical protein